MWPIKRISSAEGVVWMRLVEGGAHATRTPPPSTTGSGIVAARRVGELPEGVALLLFREPLLDPGALVDVLRRLGQGEIAAAPALGPRSPADPVDELSRRQQEVLALVAEGLSNIEIGRRLFITARTVEAHIKEIFRELRLPGGPSTNRRVLAVLAHLRAGGAAS